jgi:hypothetical protein
VLVPLLAVIGFLSIYPQLALHRSEASVKATVARVQAGSAPRLAAAGCPPLALGLREDQRCYSFASAPH